MKKLATHTLGCRLNQFETEKLASGLYPAGFERAEFSETADLYLINTCTVTHKADATCRQMISNVARRKGSAKLVVIGCYVESDRARVADLAGVDLVIGNTEKSRAREIISEAWPELFPADFVTGCRAPLEDFHNRSRAWLKISDGCNQKCSFCIIPTVRGALRNNSAENVIRDINEMVEAGYSEVVLTGVHIGHFKDSSCDVSSLVDLIRMILRETDLQRLRLSSLEPQVVDDKIVSLMAEETSRICRYLHLPLQSGSDAVLSSMRRPYDRAKYLSVLRLLKDTIHGITLGGDVIVGFPSETDADLADTAAIADSGLMDYLHVFTYSDRAGTSASAMSEKVDPRVVANRHKQLRQISKRRLAEAHKRAVGAELTAISENLDPKSGRWLGVTDNYLHVLFPTGVGGDRAIHRIVAGEYQDGHLDCGDLPMNPSISSSTENSQPTSI